MAYTQSCRHAEYPNHSNLNQIEQIFYRSKANPELYPGTDNGKIGQEQGRKESVDSAERRGGV
jgi:hypothetical protein